jgi:hypothetical protein
LTKVYAPTFDQPQGVVSGICYPYPDKVVLGVGRTGEPYDWLLMSFNQLASATELLDNPAIQAISKVFRPGVLATPAARSITE